MARNGSGVYSLPSTNYPAVSGTLITAANRNAVDSDIANALTGSLAANGETPVTGDINMGNNKLINHPKGTSRTDSASVANIQDGTGIYVATVGGTADVITLTPNPAIASYAAGQSFEFIASGANTTNVTVNVSGLGAIALTKNGSVALVAGDIQSGALVKIVYDGTRFQLISFAKDSTIIGTNLIGSNTTLTNNNQWNVLHYVTTTTTLTITLATPASNNGKFVYLSNITGNIVFITTPSGVINAQGLSATTIALGRGESLILTTDGTNYIQVARNGDGVMDLTAYAGADIELAVGQTAIYNPTAVTSQALRLKTSDNQVYIRNAQDTGVIAGVTAQIDLQMNNTDYVGAHQHIQSHLEVSTNTPSANSQMLNRFGLNIRSTGYVSPYSCEIYTAAASRRKAVVCQYATFSSSVGGFCGGFVSTNDNAVSWTSMGTEFYGRSYSGIISYTRVR